MTDAPAQATTDLSDDHPDAQVCDPVFQAFGGRPAFSGPVTTLKVFEDNALVRDAVEQPGEGRVLVVDGGGSLHTALMGDLIAGLGVANGWAGVMINGAVRDVAVLRTLDLGIKALGSNPRKSGKTGAGERDVPVSFGGITVRSGDQVTSDDDGIVVHPS
jgi:regulator of ribonuclease activity A